MIRKAIVVAAVIALLAGAVVSPSYGNNGLEEADLRVFEGSVTNVDISRALLTVKSSVEITFPISSGTKLTRDIYDIKLSDIGMGDYVAVSYYRSGSNSRIPAKVTKVVVEYKGKGIKESGY